MVCAMCDSDGNPCDDCKNMDRDGDYYLWQEEERLDKEMEGENDKKISNG